MSIKKELLIILIKSILKEYEDYFSYSFLLFILFYMSNTKNALKSILVRIKEAYTKQLYFNFIF